MIFLVGGKTIFDLMVHALPLCSFSFAQAYNTLCVIRCHRPSAAYYLATRQGTGVRHTAVAPMVQRGSIWSCPCSCVPVNGFDLFDDGNHADQCYLLIIYFDCHLIVNA